ncbi:hypothetical protein AAHZ94_26310 [Streptomyces sp. HSW2009]
MIRGGRASLSGVSRSPMGRVLRVVAVAPWKGDLERFASRKV